nr:MAG TPA: hypothetical protein [Caudoviricetes sp.]
MKQKNSELFVQPACSVCEDMAGEHGEVTELVDVNQDVRCKIPG